MEKLVKVKFVIQPDDMNEFPDQVEYFHIGFPASDLPKTGDLIGRKLPGGTVKMFIVGRKAFYTQHGRVQFAYYMVTEQ